MLLVKQQNLRINMQKLRSSAVVLTMRLGGRANADEMAASLQELGAMQTTAAELRGRILDVDSGLSRVGKAYLHHLTDWQEHSSITANLTHSIQVDRGPCAMLLSMRATG